MTEEQTTPEATAETAAEVKAQATPEAETPPAKTTDPDRQAELDGLAAELQGKAPAKKPVRKSRRVTVKDPNEIDPDAAAGAAESDSEPAESAEPAKKPARSSAKRGTKAAAAAAKSESDTKSAEAGDGDAQAESEGAKSEPAKSDAAKSDTAKSDAAKSEDGATADDGGADSDGGDGGDSEAGEGSGRSRSRRGRSRSRNGNGGSEGQSDGDDDRGGSANRNRDRGRKRSGGRLGEDVEPEILPDDVLLPIAGILDVLDNYAFVRTTGYLAGITDVYVSLGQVKKYGLRKGDAVVGAIRQPREGEQQGRQKYNALVKVESVNGLTAEGSVARSEFHELTPVRPSQPLAGTTQKGQREVVIGATGAGKTQRIAGLAAEVSAAQPEAHLIVILVGPRPEEVTEFRRAVKGEVVVSGLELSAEDHVTVVELAVERAKRLVELGIDVVVLIDSITQLGRAYASTAPGTRGILDDPSIALPAKRLLGAARATEEGASLTIVATASAETPLDRLVATELVSIANATVQL